MHSNYVGFEQKNCFPLCLPVTTSVTIKDTVEDTNPCLSRSNYNKVVFITNNDVAFIAGNSIQILSLSSLQNKVSANEDMVVDDAAASYRCSLSSYDAEDNLLQGSSSALLWSSMRGISCLDYNAHSSLLAYSERQTNPEIVVTSLFPERKKLCTLKGGSLLEYSDITFNLKGTRLLSFGKHDMDSKIWVWQLCPDKSSSSSLQHEKKKSSNDYDDKECLSQSSLLYEIKTENPCLMCRFNPLNHDQIAYIDVQQRNVFVCKALHDYNEYQVHIEDCDLPHDLISPSSNGENNICVSTISWELRNILLVGTSCSTLLVFDTSRRILIHRVESQHNLKANLLSIFVTKNNLILGFDCGIIQWRRRPVFAGNIKPGNIEKEIQLNCKLTTMALSVDVDTMIAITSDGWVKRFPIDSDRYDSTKDDENGSLHSEQALDDCPSTGIDPDVVGQFHSGIITSLTSIVLSDETKLISLIISGASDGTVKVWKDVSFSSLPQRTRAKGCIASMKLNTSITSMTALEGFPVFSVGTSDGIIRMVHIKRKLDLIDLVTEGSPTNQVSLSIIHEEKLCSDAAPTSMKYNPTEKILAVGCFQSGMVFVLSAETHELNIIGKMSTEFESSLVALDWMNDAIVHYNSCYLLVGSCNEGRITCYHVSTIRSSSSSPTRDEVLPCWTCSLPGVDIIHSFTVSSTNKITIENDGSNNHQNRTIYVLHDSKRGLDCFSISPSDGECKSLTKSIITSEVEDKLLCSKPGGTCIIDEEEDFGVILHGSISGEVCVYKIHNGKLYLSDTCRVHSFGPVSSLTLSSDGSRLYSSSLDGSFFVIDIKGNNNGQGRSQIPSSSDYDYLVGSS